MHTIRKIYQYIKETNPPGDRKLLFPHFYDKFTQENRDKKRIIYINPRINRFSLYSMLAPAMHINAYSQRITCIVAGMAPDKKELDISFEQADHATVKRSEVELANMIVFPFTGEDLLPTFAEMRRWNPFIKIVYCVDYNFYDVPESHFQHKVIQEQLQDIENNIKGHTHMPGADYICIARPEFEPYLRQKLNAPHINIMVMPQLLSRGFTEDIDFQQPPADKKKRRIRIGVFSDKFRDADIRANKELYLWLQTDKEKEVDLFFYGSDPYYGSAATKPIYPAEAVVENNDQPQAEIEKAAGKKSRLKPQEKVPKAKTKGKPLPPEPVKIIDPKDNYSRRPREPYMYNFKDFYNYNFDLLLFLYDRKSEFWKYTSDIDMLMAVYFEKPVLTNLEIDSVFVAPTLAAQKKWLDKYIETQMQYLYGDDPNEYMLKALETAYAMDEAGTWNPKSQAYIEEFLLTIMAPKDLASIEIPKPAMQDVPVETTYKIPEKKDDVEPNKEN